MIKGEMKKHDEYVTYSYNNQNYNAYAGFSKTTLEEEIVKCQKAGFEIGVRVKRKNSTYQPSTGTVVAWAAEPKESYTYSSGAYYPMKVQWDGSKAPSSIAYNMSEVELLNENQTS